MIKCHFGVALDLARFGKQSYLENIIKQSYLKIDFKNDRLAGEERGCGRLPAKRTGGGEVASPAPYVGGRGFGPAGQTEPLLAFFETPNRRPRKMR